MEFKLENVIPWGKNLDEYKKMFDLSEADLNKRIASFADGTSSFNSEMSMHSRRVTSLDPIYQFDIEELSAWIKGIVAGVERTPSGNAQRIEDDFSRLKRTRIQAVRYFINDFERGKSQSRYVPYMLPKRLGYADQCFDLGLCANFLFLYTDLGLEFHRDSIQEMLRLCREIRIFPIVDFRGRRSDILDDITILFCDKYAVEIVAVDFGFQGIGYEMLRISRR